LTRVSYEFKRIAGSGEQTAADEEWSVVVHQRMVETEPNARLPDVPGYGYSH